MHQTGHWHVTVFATGIGHFIGVIPSLLDARNNLPPNGAIGIGWVNQIEEMGRDGQCELVTAEQDAGALGVAENKMLFKSRQRGDPVLQLPDVIVPVGCADILVFPIARRVAAEVLLGKRLGCEHRIFQDKASG